MVAITTATLSSLPSMNAASLDSDSGGWLVLDMNSRFSTAALNLESVRRAEEAVELDEQLDVHVLRLGGRAVLLLVAAAGDEVDTL